MRSTGAFGVAQPQSQGNLGHLRMDETYKKVHGFWVYQYHAVDKAGQTVDFVLSRNRDVNAAKSFLRSRMKNACVTAKITLDAYAASHRAVREMQEDGELPRRVRPTWS